MSFSIIIPSRTTSNLIPCVDAIRACGETVPIIVVDDGLDPEPMRVNGWWPAKVGPISFEGGMKPFIFARNVNRGILAAGTDDVVILNDDALLQRHTGFTGMALRAAEHPEYGVIASTCNNVGNRNQWNQARPVEEMYALRDEPRMVCFVCVYIPRSTIEKVGLLDERYVGYGFDDDDYCLRVRRAGLEIGIYDGCYVDHGSLKSTFRGEPGTAGSLAQNSAIFREKWGAGNWDL